MKSKLDTILVSIVAFFYTLLWNLDSKGPAYLSDAVGYMVNAAIMAGHRVDAMGSWHAGYSIFLIPAFLLDDPFVAWKVVLGITSLMSALSVLLCAAWIQKLSPDISRLPRLACLALIVIYPAFSSIAGYGYSSPALSSVILLIGLLAIRKDELNYLDVSIIAMLGGFAYWVHPTGIAVALASLGTIFVKSRERRFIRVCISIVICSAMVIVYKRLLHSELYNLVTPAGLVPYDHYQGAWKQLAKVDAERFLNLLGLTLGQVSYLIVSTFGVAWLGYFTMYEVIKNKWKFIYNNKNDVERRWFVVSVYGILLVSGLLGIAVLTFSGGRLGRSDYWIYGRYTDAAMYPMLVVGGLVVAGQDILRKYGKSFWYWGSALLIVAMAVALLSWIVPGGLPHSYQSTLGFWPQYLNENSVPGGLVLGWLGVLLAAILVYLLGNRSLYSVLVLFIFSAYFSGVGNMNDRHVWEAQYSKPSSIVEVVRANWPRHSCVGFSHPLPRNISLMQVERYRLYAYYFYNYYYRRYSLQEWKEKCDGPLLTYDVQAIVDDPELQILLKERSTGLMLVRKRTSTELIVTDDASKRGGAILIEGMSRNCILSGCFSESARQLRKFNQVGFYENGKIKTDGRAGFLFYGPYKSLRTGKYKVAIDAEISWAPDAILEIVAFGGERIIKIVTLDQFLTEEKVEIPFEIGEDINDLEIRLKVGVEDQLTFERYSIQDNS